MALFDAFYTDGFDPRWSETCQTAIVHPWIIPLAVIVMSFIYIFISIVSALDLLTSDSLRFSSLSGSTDTTNRRSSRREEHRWPPAINTRRTSPPCQSLSRLSSFMACVLSLAGPFCRYFGQHGKTAISRHKFS